MGRLFPISIPGPAPFSWTMDQRTKMVSEPSVHNSRCWFTQEGFEKYGDLVEEVVKERMENFSEGEMRILKRPKLENIVMHGKIQCIQLI